MVARTQTKQAEKPNAAMVVKIGLPDSKPNPDTQKANQKADAAKGEAVAVTFIKFAQDTAVKGKRFLMDIDELGQAGRTAFRTAISAHLKVMREELKQNEDTEAYELLKRAFNSTQARFSEAVTFSKACDVGFEFNFEDGYHDLIGTARVALQSESANGPTVKTGKRGRKAKPLLDKVKAFLLSLNATADDFGQIAEMARTLQQLATAKA